jgi:hypothetical protein
MAVENDGLSYLINKNSDFLPYLNSKSKSNPWVYVNSTGLSGEYYRYVKIICIDMVIRFFLIDFEMEKWTECNYIEREVGKYGERVS